jgi:soluble cytochrome b562
MKAFRAVVLGLALALAPLGCTLKPVDLPVSTSLSASAQSVQLVLDQARVLVISVARTVSQYLTDGLLTKDEGKSYYDRLKSANDKLTAAQALLDSGVVGDAKVQADLVHELTLALHKQLLAKAGK